MTAPTLALGLLAQAAPAPTGAPAPNPAAQIFPIALIMGLIVFMFLTARSQKKREERERKELFESLSKNDRVLTVGGVIGTIITIRDTEVVLKVDESTNTKMTFVKTAIQRVLNDDAEK